MAAIVLANLTDNGNPAMTYYGTTTKRYREIYVGGEFSHFETNIKIKIYSDSSRKKLVCSNTKTYEGQMMMSEDH